MKREDLIKQAKAILTEAYEEAAEMIVFYLEDHPSEQCKTLCREIDPDNWNALDHRVRRAKAKRASKQDGSAAPAVPEWVKRDERDARRVLRQAEPETVDRLVEDLTPERRAKLASRFLADPDTRSAMVDEPEGVAAVEAIHRQAALGREPVVPEREPLPPPPSFAAKFWRAVNALQDANAQLRAVRRERPRRAPGDTGGGRRNGRARPGHPRSGGRLRRGKHCNRGDPMSRRNAFIPIVEVALDRALERELAATPRTLHDILMDENDLLTAQIRAFDTEQGMNALRVGAVKFVLNEFGEAVSEGRDAEHVAERTRESLAQRIAMLEQKRAQIEESLAAHRDEYAQLTLDIDVERATAAGA